MKNRWLINIVLVLFVALLAVILLYGPDKKDSVKEIPLTSLVTGDIKKITISRTSLASLSLEKDDQGWRLSKPFPARANEYNVNALLQIAHARVEAGFPGAEHDLDKFGLKKAVTTLMLGDHEIKIGRHHPLKNARYALSGGSIFVIPMHNIRITENSVNDFINSRILNEGTKLAEISLPALKLAEKNGQWIVVSDKNKSGKPTADKINDFILEWENARALTVMPYSGRQPVGKIKLRSRQAPGNLQQFELGIIAYEPELILFRKDEGLEYHFPQEAGKRLLRPQQPVGDTVNKR